MSDKFLFPSPAYKFSYKLQAGVCGQIKGSQEKNSKSHIWVDARPEITLTTCLLPTEMGRNLDWDLSFCLAKSEVLLFFLDLKKMVGVRGPLRYIHKYSIKL